VDGGGGGGGGFHLCDNQRNFWKSTKIHPIARRFGHEGLVKAKLSKYIVNRERIKLSIPSLNVKINPLLEIEILLPELS
jgi:hypothetical protein